MPLAACHDISPVYQGRHIRCRSCRCTRVLSDLESRASVPSCSPCSCMYFDGPGQMDKPTEVALPGCSMAATSNEYLNHCQAVSGSLLAFPSCATVDGSFVPTHGRAKLQGASCETSRPKGKCQHMVGHVSSISSTCVCLHWFPALVSACVCIKKKIASTFNT